MDKLLFTSLHEVSPLTMAIIASHDEGGKPVSYVLEETTEYISNNTPSKLIDKACKFFGSSLRGRQEGTRDISGLTHKVPVSIDPSSGMYFFPTSSPTSSKCSWIAHSHIDEISRSEDGRTEITFKNGKKIRLEISYGSMLNQIRRTAQFRFLLDNRIRFIKSKLDFEVFEEP